MSARTSLTLRYGGLFLLSGAALMATAYVLLVNAGFVFTIPGASGDGHATPVIRSAGGAPARPSKATMAHWRDVAQCMRTHGVSAFPDPRTSMPSSLGFRDVEMRDGAIFVIPATVDQQSAIFIRASARCQLSPDAQRTIAQDDRRRAQVRDQLLIQSGIALAVMSLLSLALGWLMAGRVLRPLEAAHEAQRQFVANASHELRAPLTRLRALIQVALANPQADTASLRAAHERVLAAEQDLEQMIDALLALARGQAEPARAEQADLRRIAYDVTLAHESEIEEAGIELRRALAPVLTGGDPRLIERLVVNLVQNGVRHNVPGGWVEVTTGIRGRQPFLSVANSGPVVDPQEVDRLFEPFARSGTARTSHGDGHGLGLSIVQAVARAHGAEIAARAQAGGGLLVEVAFPLGPSRSGRSVFSRRPRHINADAMASD